MLSRLLAIAPALIALAASVLPLGAPAADAADLPTTDAASRDAVFHARDEFPTFAGRVDPGTYRIGPGDEIALRFSDLLDPRIIRVGPAGDLLLPNAGPIPAAGLTLRELETRARELLRPFIRGKGFILTLHRPRRFLAIVVGEVGRPGAVSVQAPVRASEVIDAAGGVAPGGARRGVIVRRGEDSLWVDLVRFDRIGDLEANPLVFETDVIVVPPSTRRVEILGAVAHPGIYDLAPGDRLSALVAAAGGLLPRAALDAAELSRSMRPGTLERAPLRIEAALAEPGGADDVPLEDGDRIFLPEHAHWRESARVRVTGEVARPGDYPIVDGADRAGALIERAGGYTEWADRGAVRIERDSDAAVRDSAFLRLAREQEGILEDGERDYFIAVTRERRALSVGIGAFLESGKERGDVPLLDGDRIVVPRRTLTVMVQGEVKRPGHVPFEPGRDAGDYVRAAGGYTSRASKGGVRVTLAATSRPVGASDAGTLSPGDIVWVPAKAPRSAWGAVRDVLTTAAQAATIYLVVREATK